MSMQEVLLIRYGELGLKRANRGEFEKALERHVSWAVRDMPGARVVRTHGRLFVEGEFCKRASLERLAKVPGIVAINPARKVPSEISAIREGAVACLSQAQESVHVNSFKVEARRSDKSFPLTSPEINGALGGTILNAFPGLSVDVHSPDVTLRVEVREDGTYLYWEQVLGPGGLPIGTSGRGLLLISGGIDSPVAGYLAMKRGISLAALHFWSYPITGQRAKDKVIALSRILMEYDPQFRLYIARFTEIQTAILEKAPERFRITVMRRMMMRVASLFAEKIRAQAIFTGENVGQVASQTIESLAAIQDAASLPVLRPLICFNKTETTQIAKSIGTYDLSVLPYEDCCSVFVPKHPVIKPTLDEARTAESSLEIEDLVSRCVQEIQEADLVL
jgi:thiamine biosynthesis protein ThiI